eukprot:4310134-Pleurochrysis_carterae.AAC.1
MQEEKESLHSADTGVRRDHMPGTISRSIQIARADSIPEQRAVRETRHDEGYAVALGTQCSARVGSPSARALHCDRSSGVGGVCPSVAAARTAPMSNPYSDRRTMRRSSRGGRPCSLACDRSSLRAASCDGDGDASSSATCTSTAQGDAMQFGPRAQRARQSPVASAALKPSRGIVHTSAS